MSLNLPTTADLFATFLANFEAEINQEAPLVDKAYLRVTSAIEAGLVSLILKFGVERSAESLALTASEAGLTVIGA